MTQVIRRFLRLQHVQGPPKRGCMGQCTTLCPFSTAFSQIANDPKNLEA